jgi:CelD/BcsL family acetyltransferase involved in cellulose biosynthesis
MNTLRTDIISTDEQFRDLRDPWNDLLSRSRTNTIFLTWEWLYSWWEVFRKDVELFIVTVKNEQEELVGIAPLCLQKVKYYGFPVRELTFLGTGHSDRQDFLIAADSHVEGNVLHGIIAALKEHSKEWNVVCLDQIPDESLLVSMVADYPFDGEWELSSHCSYVRINGAWDVYLKSRSKKFRKDIRNKENNLDRLGEWELAVTSDVGDFDTYASLMREIESRSRKNDTEKAFWAQDGNREFLTCFASRAAEHGWLDFTTLRLKGIPIAHLLGFSYNGSYSAYNTAYIDAYFDVSPGKLVIHEKIKWCFDQGASIREFDFLRGAFYIKSLWATDVRQHRRLVGFRDSLYAKTLKFAAFRVRPLLKKFMTMVRRPDLPSVSDAG